jgi:hypothetical protein
VHLERLLERTVQPPERAGPLAPLRLTGLLEGGQAAVGLRPAVPEQRVEPDRGRLHVELERLPRRDARHQLTEGVRHMGALGV